MFCSWLGWHPSCNWSHDYLPLLSIVHQLPTNFPQTFQSVRPMTYDQDIFDPSGEDLKTTTYRRRMSHQPHQTSFSKVSGNQRFVLRGIQTTRNIEPENRWKKAPKKRGTIWSKMHIHIFGAFHDHGSFHFFGSNTWPFHSANRFREFPPASSCRCRASPKSCVHDRILK